MTPCRIRIWNPVGGLRWSFSAETVNALSPWRISKCDSVWGGFHHWCSTRESCLLILLIHTKHKNNKMKYCTDLFSWFPLRRTHHWVDKTENVWLIFKQLPIKAGWWDVPLALGFQLKQYARTTIRPEFSVPTYLFLLFAHDHSTKIYGLLSFNLSFVHDHSTKN